MINKIVFNIVLECALEFAKEIDLKWLRILNFVVTVKLFLIHNRFLFDLDIYNNEQAKCLNS